ncbi:cupin domain-containing protein [Streptomyces polygonati]|uniref:Cupin domain-containing protein n=1 Tax=Streptomyces polygonati TaxID=1617087 RepID=A0ABV8HIQ3_9ACTN
MSRTVPNLYQDLLADVAHCHDGTGVIRAHRILQRLPAPAGVDFIDLAVLPPGTSIGVHRHKDDEETYVILAGTGTMTLDDEEFTVRAGDVVVNRAFGRHGLVNAADHDLRLLVFQTGPATAGQPRQDGTDPR